MGYKNSYSATENHMDKLKKMLLDNLREGEWSTIVSVILPWWKEIDFPKTIDANGKLRANVLEMFRKKSEDL